MRERGYHCIQRRIAQQAKCPVEARFACTVCTRDKIQLAERQDQFAQRPVARYCERLEHVLKRILRKDARKNQVCRNELLQLAAILTWSVSSSTSPTLSLSPPYLRSRR